MLRLAALAAGAVAAALVPATGALAQARAFIRDAEIERTLDMMLYPVREAAGLGENDVRMFILLDDNLNAFVAGGPNMFLNTGLLRRIERPETLIGVMAHELGHVTGGHLARRAVTQRALSTPALLATLLAGAAAGAAGGGQAGAAAVLGAQSLIERSLLAYSRAEEAAADQAAVSYMGAAGVDPEGMLDILRLFKGQEVFRGDRIDPWALTHPLSSERISLLERRVEGSPARGAAPDPDIAYWHARMRAKLDGFTLSPRLVLDRVATSADPDGEINLYRQAAALHRAADAAGAIEAVDRLIALRPDDPYYRELKGQILFESARPAEALAPLRRAVSLAPDSALIAGALGRALLAAGGDANEAEALSTLERAARDEPPEPAVLRDLATAYARAGRDGEAALATARRLALGGDIASAQRMARRAMDLLPRGAPGWLRAEDIAKMTRPDG